MTGQPSRTQVILAAVQRALADRAALIDAADDLGSVTVTVRLQAGTTTVRGLVVQDERVGAPRLR